MKTESDRNSPSATIDAPEKPARRSPAHTAWDDGEAEVSGFRKWSVPLFAGLALAGAIGFAAHSMSKKQAAPTKQVMEVKFIPPAPTPRPPVQQTPTPTPPPEIVPRDVEKIDKPIKPKSPVAPPAPITTANGKDGRGELTFGRGPTPFGRQPPDGEGVDPTWIAYAAKVNASIVHALENDSRTRKISGRFIIRVSVDSTGRITRVEFLTSSGDAKTDAMIRDEILTGLQMAEQPPPGMQCVKLQVNARRPN